MQWSSKSKRCLKSAVCVKMLNSEIGLLALAVLSSESQRSVSDEISHKERHPLGKTFCSKYYMMTGYKWPGKGFMSSKLPAIKICTALLPCFRICNILSELNLYRGKIKLQFCVCSNAKVLLLPYIPEFT